jgi:hypothetical protein
MHEYQTGMIAGRPSWKTNGAEADSLIHKSDQLHDQNARRILYITM